MGLWDLRARKVKALSSGEKQRFGISMALFSDPPLLIFDEPISSVDVKGELDFVASVRKLAGLGKTIFITTHRPGFAEISQEVIVLNKGKVVAVGSPSTLLNKIKVLDVMYIKLRNEGDISEGIKITEDLGIEVHPRDGCWLVARVPSELKAALLGKLSERGFGIDDLTCESAVIESEYYALLEQDLKP